MQGVKKGPLGRRVVISKGCEEHHRASVPRVAVHRGRSQEQSGEATWGGKGISTLQTHENCGFYSECDASSVGSGDERQCMLTYDLKGSPWLPREKVRWG